MTTMNRRTLLKTASSVAGIPMVSQVMTVRWRGRKTNSTRKMLVRVKNTTRKLSTAE